MTMKSATLKGDPMAGPLEGPSWKILAKCGDSKGYTYIGENSMGTV